MVGGGRAEQGHLVAPRSPSSALCPLSWSGWAHALQAGTDLPDPDPPASRRETLWEVQEKLMSFLCSVWFLVDEEFAMKPVNNSQQRKSTGSHEAAGMRGTRLRRCTASWRVEVPCGLYCSHQLSRESDGESVTRLVALSFGWVRQRRSVC